MIDDRLSMIKVSEMIKTEPEEMEKITLIEQICEFLYYNSKPGTIYSPGEWCKLRRLSGWTLDHH